MLDGVDTDSLPLTEPHPAPIFDTGPHPDPLVSYHSDVFGYPPPVASASLASLGGDAEPNGEPGSAIVSKPLPIPVPPVAVPGQFQFVKRWKFALVLAGVWVAAGAVGAGLYYWWFHSFDKTWPDVGVLCYVIACIVVALLVSMAESKPMVSSLAVGIISAPYASGCAAAALYGAYAFGWVTS
jgi:hypothetical protein